MDPKRDTCRRRGAPSRAGSPVRLPCVKNSAPNGSTEADLARDIRRVVRGALDEDHAWRDVTTLWSVPADATAEARIISKQAGVLAGLAMVDEVYRQIDPQVKVVRHAVDSDPLVSRQTIVTLSGSARSIVTGERTALNLLQRASGIATHTSRFLRELAGLDVLLRDTRKTAPGLRRLDKYSVVCGGGANHRMGLDDLVLLKENHLRAAGGIGAAIDGVRQGQAVTSGSHLGVEVEVTSLAEADEALDCGVEWILLDNMSLDELREAVRRRNAKRAATRLEASGDVTLETVRDVGLTGVEAIAVGAITHSAPALDVSLLVNRSLRNVPTAAGGRAVIASAGT